MSQASFAKRQREKARREKAAAKSARREERRSTTNDDDKPSTTPSEQAILLDQLAKLHQAFEAGEMTFDDFSAAKEDLTQRLDIS